MLKITYIHGLNSSPTVFNYLIKSLPPHESFPVSYNSSKSINLCIESIKNQLNPETDVIIGHSLGGLIGYHLVSNGIRAHLITASSPFGGSIFASRLKWFNPQIPILADICPSSQFIKNLFKDKILDNHLALISTRGSSFFTMEKNDGVVTYSSQVAIPHFSRFEINANHFEIVQHEQTLSCIENFLAGKNDDD